MRHSANTDLRNFLPHTTNAGWHANRKSRHLYDLEKMMDEPFAEPTIHNDDLWESICHHRQVFTSMRDVDYTPDVRKRIVLVPPADPFACKFSAKYLELPEILLTFAADYQGVLPIGG